MARVAIRKISFKPTNRRSSHAPAAAGPSGQRSVRPGDAGFRHPQAQRRIVPFPRMNSLDLRTRRSSGLTPMRVSRRLHLQASVWSPNGPLRVGSTFDTIGPHRGRRPGQRTSYQVTALGPTVNTVEILHHRLFEHAVSTFRFFPAGQRTKVACSVDLVAKRRYILIVPALGAARGSLLGDLGYLRASSRQIQATRKSSASKGPSRRANPAANRGDSARRLAPL